MTSAAHNTVSLFDVVRYKGKTLKSVYILHGNCHECRKLIAIPKQQIKLLYDVKNMVNSFHKEQVWATKYSDNL